MHQQAGALRNAVQRVIHHDGDARAGAAGPGVMLSRERGGAAAGYIYADMLDAPRPFQAAKRPDQIPQLAVEVLEAALLADPVHKNKADSLLWLLRRRLALKRGNPGRLRQRSRRRLVVRDWTDCAAFHRRSRPQRRGPRQSGTTAE